MAGSWSNGATDLIILVEEVSGFSGVFGYSPAPGAGNLVFSLTAAAGTDPYGNSYAAGLTMYSADGTINLWDTAGTWNSSSGSGIQILVGAGSVLEQFTPTTVNGVTWDNGATGATLASRLGTNTPETFLVSPNNAANPGANASIGLYGAPQTSNGDVLSECIIDAQRTWVNALTIAWITSAWIKEAEVWHVPSLGSGWAAGPSGGTVQHVQYRLDAEDNLVIVGAVHSTSTTPAATIFTLPAGWRPAVTQRSPGVSNSAGTATARYVEVNSSGAVSINANLTTSSTDVYFQVCVPMGNIS